jgi:hypothetical protein
MVSVQQPAGRRNRSQDRSRLPVGTAALVIGLASALAWFGVVAAINGAVR